MSRVARQRAVLAACVSTGLLFGGLHCTAIEPEVVVVNKTAEHILVKNVSFNGALWECVLAYDEATSPQRCLPGEDRVHFQKFDPYSYCHTQAEYGLVDSLCLCDSATVSILDSSVISATPLWYNYQTVSVHEVQRGEFYVYEITLDDVEQDFSAPGPYGH